MLVLRLFITTTTVCETTGDRSMAIIDVKTEISGNVWKVVAEAGAQLEEDDTIIILESMKMEIPVSAPRDGKVSEILVEPEQTVAEGDVVARMEV